jgi:uncharacterized protein (UPF0333 family)
VEKLVRRSEHPNPLVLVIIIIVIIVVMYVLHTMFLKLSLSGEWRDADDNLHIICHNKWNDRIIVDSHYTGTVNGNMLMVHKDDQLESGIWARHQIKWTDGSSWRCATLH